MQGPTCSRDESPSPIISAELPPSPAAHWKDSPFPSIPFSPSTPFSSWFGAFLSLFCPVLNTRRSATCFLLLSQLATTLRKCWVPVVRKMMEMRITSCGCYAGIQDFQLQTCFPGSENLLGLLHVDRASSKLHERLFFMQNKALFK